MWREFSANLRCTSSDLGPRPRFAPFYLRPKQSSSTSFSCFPFRRELASSVTRRSAGSFRLLRVLRKFTPLKRKYIMGRLAPPRFDARHASCDRLATFRLSARVARNFLARRLSHVISTPTFSCHCSLDMPRSSRTGCRRLRLSWPSAFAWGRRTWGILAFRRLRRPPLDARAALSSDVR